MTKKDLELVKNYQKELKLIGISLALLNWDLETNMPKEGIESRSESSAYLAGQAHKKATSNEFFNAVKRLKKSKLKGDDKLMIEKLEKGLTKTRKLPQEFVEDLERTTTKANQAWKEARDKNKFEIFKPHLKKIVELKRKESSYYKMPGHPYNGLLDDFEEGMTVEELRPKFEELKVGLKELLRKIESSKKYKSQKLTLLNKKYPKSLQMELVKDVTERMGLKKEVSRIDFSEHPFTTTIGLNDVRITTAIRGKPMFSFESSIHEAGHALYELGMPKNHFFDALGGEPSLGIHESQSRFWENMIGKSKPFWKLYFPKFSKKFNLGKNWEKFYEEVNQIEKGKIRVEADEIHYCLHVILRFEIETALLENKIQVHELPKIWNKKMIELIGVSPKNDKEGVLQDTHWSGGAFGYFPTYALGTIYAAQLYKKASGEIPNIEKKISSGKFDEIRTWLNNKVHKHGRKYLAEDLIKKVCGTSLDIPTYLEHLNKKYLKIYSE